MLSHTCFMCVYILLMFSKYIYYILFILMLFMFMFIFVFTFPYLVIPCNVYLCLHMLLFVYNTIYGHYTSYM